MIRSAEEFVELRENNDPRATHDKALEQSGWKSSGVTRNSRYGSSTTRPCRCPSCAFWHATLMATFALRSP